MPRHSVPCATCGGKKYLPLDAKVHLPFAKRDWLECPDCGGTGEMVIYEETVTPKKIIAVGGI